ncbi:MAG: hypothetical protein ACLFR1_07685 [Spirochaetia bacterium]
MKTAIFFLYITLLPFTIGSQTLEDYFSSAIEQSEAYQIIQHQLELLDILEERNNVSQGFTVSGGMLQNGTNTIASVTTSSERDTILQGDPNISYQFHENTGSKISVSFPYSFNFDQEEGLQLTPAFRFYQNLDPFFGIERDRLSEMRLSADRESLFWDISVQENRIRREVSAAVLEMMNLDRQRAAAEFQLNSSLDSLEDARRLDRYGEESIEFQRLEMQVRRAEIELSQNQLDRETAEQDFFQLTAMEYVPPEIPETETIPESFRFGNSYIAALETAYATAELEETASGSPPEFLVDTEYQFSLAPSPSAADRLSLTLQINNGPYSASATMAYNFIADELSFSTGFSWNASTLISQDLDIRQQETEQSIQRLRESSAAETDAETHRNYLRELESLSVDIELSLMEIELAEQEAERLRERINRGMASQNDLDQKVHEIEIAELNLRITRMQMYSAILQIQGLFIEENN